jgi:rfaE bifunctional protein nucleotidyltransferase chain/domain
MLKNKIINNSVKLKKLIFKDKKSGKKIVFTNGCFDILHYGHAKYLEQAKSEGDILVVALNSDSSVKKIKGDKRPIINEKKRQGLIAALESVNYVTLFNQETPLKLITLLRPDVLVKGGDWSKDKIIGSDVVLKYGGKVITINFVKGNSTTGIIKKIAQSS